MPSAFGVDNDVLIKLSHFGLLEQFGAVLGGRDKAGILGAARYVVPKRIRKQVEDASDVIAAFEQFTAGLEVLEPSVDERNLAARLEELASGVALDLDSGESQLAAIVVTRLMERLLTGDKRAIRALASLHEENDSGLEHLGGRVACVEQVIVELVNQYGAAEVRASVCAAAFIDRALSICFSCTAPSAHEDSIREGLSSYINELRSECDAVVATKVVD